MCQLGEQHSQAEGGFVGTGMKFALILSVLGNIIKAAFGMRDRYGAWCWNFGVQWPVPGNDWGMMCEIIKPWG